MTQINNADEIATNSAGTLLLRQIEESSTQYSDKASTDLATALITNKMKSEETLLQYHRRHTDILKTLYKRGMTAEKILKLIEKTVWLSGLPDSTFRDMKNVVGNDDINLDQMFVRATDVQNLDNLDNKRLHARQAPAAKVTKLSHGVYKTSHHTWSYFRYVCVCVCVVLCACVRLHCICM